MDPHIRPDGRRLTRVFSSLVVTVAIATPVGALGQSYPPTIPPVLTLELAREILDESNPEVLVAREDVAIARAGVLDARLYPNPTITYDASNVGGSGTSGGGFWDRQDLVLKIEQTILLGGKRSNRTAAAEHGVDASLASLGDVQRRQRFELERRYYTVVLGKAALDSSVRILEQFDEIIALSELRYARGESSGLELARLRTERLRFFNDRVDADLQLRIAKAGLLEILGSQSDADFDVRERLEFQPQSVELQALEARALAQRPELAAGLARLEQSRSQSRAERAFRIPDVTPFVGYNRDFGQNLWAVGFSIDVPLFNRNQGGIARGVAQVSREEQDLRRNRLAVRRQVREAFLAMTAQAEKVAALESEYMPNALRARTIAEASYRLGALDLIALLDAERSYRTTVRAYQAALYDHQIAVFLVNAVVAAGSQP